MYNGRQEKDDTLRLALAVGQILADRGQDVMYTRTEDIYQTPFQKATIANDANADYFVSFHRNSSPMANQYHGVESLVYSDTGVKAQMARNINDRMESVGFTNLGVEERPGLVVLRRTKMPAVLVEAGFINSDIDNEIFDNHFDEMANAAAEGILESIPGAVNEPSAAANVIVEETESTSALELESAEVQRAPVYRVQTGAFSQRENAENLLYPLQQQGFPAYIMLEDGLYKVQVGAFGRLDNAVRMEQVLRRFGYNTYVTS